MALWKRYVTPVTCISSGDICFALTHWGQVRHIYITKLTIIGSDNGLSPDWRQVIIWTNAGILLIGPLGTNFKILIEIHIISFKKMHLKMSSAKWRPFYLDLNVLSRHWYCCIICCHQTFFHLFRYENIHWKPDMISTVVIKQIYKIGKSYFITVHH